MSLMTIGVNLSYGCFEHGHGGFNIYTVGENVSTIEDIYLQSYKRGEVKDDKGSFVFSFNFVDNKKDVIVKVGNERCVLKSSWDKSYEKFGCQPHAYSYKASSSKCKSILKNLPGSSAISVNFEKREILFPINLVRTISKNVNLTKNDLTKMQSDFLKNSTVIARHSNFKPDAELLKFSNILNFSNPNTEITKIGKRFQMIVGKFKLKNLDKMFHLGNWAGGDNVTKSLIGKTMDFPAIFIKQDKGLPRMVGDGSWCSSSVIIGETFSSTHVESLYDFKVTNAYDFSGNGLPDVIEINNKFSYQINSDNTVTVLDNDKVCGD